MKLFGAEARVKYYKTLLSTYRITNDKIRLGLRVSIERHLLVSECVTLHSLELVCLYDDAQLQHQLWSALQKGGQKMQHAHICKLIDHPPVVTPALCLTTLTTPNTQVYSMKIPGGDGGKTSRFNINQTG